MLKNYKLLETNTHEKTAIAYYHPDTVDVISLETPALEVLTDFHTTRPLIIEKNVLADQALSQMQQHKVHALLVVDENDQVIGLINAARVLSFIALMAPPNYRLKEPLFRCQKTSQTKVHFLTNFLLFQ